MDERTRTVSITAGMANVLGRTPMSDRACFECGMGFPIYPGRYPMRCPRCSGVVGRKTEAGGTVGSVPFDIAPSESLDRGKLTSVLHAAEKELRARGATGASLGASDRALKRLLDVVHALADPSGREGTPLGTGRALVKTLLAHPDPAVQRWAPKVAAALGESHERRYDAIVGDNALPVALASMLPRLQTLIDEGEPHEPRDVSCSRIRSVAYDRVEALVPGGLAGLRMVLEGPAPTMPPRFYRMEGIDDPVIVVEFDERARQVLMFATRDPVTYLGSDPRGELIAEAVEHEAEGHGVPYPIWVEWLVRDDNDITHFAAWMRENHPEIPLKEAFHPGGPIMPRDTSIIVEKPDGAGGRINGQPKAPGTAATRPVGGFRFEIGYNKRRHPRKNVELAIQNRLNARRGLASRVRAAKAWHRSSAGRAMHRDLARYNKGRAESVEVGLSTARGRDFWDVVLPAALAEGWTVRVPAEMRALAKQFGGREVHAHSSGWEGSFASREGATGFLAALRRSGAYGAMVWVRDPYHIEVYEPRSKKVDPPGAYKVESIAEDSPGILPDDRTIDDIFDSLLRRLISIESTDVLQDVEFSDDGAIYLFFDPVLQMKEMEEILEILHQEADNLALVASPDKSLPGEEVESDWWVVYVPPAAGAGPAAPDPNVYAAVPPPPGAKVPAATMVQMAPPTTIDQIALSIDVDKLIASVGKGGPKTESAFSSGTPAPEPAAGRVLPLWVPPGGREYHLRGLDEVFALLQRALSGSGRLFLIRECSYDAAVEVVGRGKLRQHTANVWSNLDDVRGFLTKLRTTGGR